MTTTQPPHSHARGPAAAVRAPWWRATLLALLPAGIVLAAIALLFGAGPRQFLPIWSDEVVYWNEAAVFAEAGFEGGYITIQEEPARWSVSRFGPHGPAFPVFHGVIARALGWQPYSAFLVNLVLVTLAAFIWARIVPGAASLAGVFVAATFWPLLLYLPTNMQEPTHFAFAFLFAAALGAAPGRARYAWTAVLLVVASLVRPSWMLMLLPLGWPYARRRGVPGLAALLAVTAAACAAAWTIFDVTASPSPQNTRVLTEAWADSAAAAFARLRAIVAENLTQYVALREESPQILLRYFLALFVGLLGFRWAGARTRSPERAETLEVALLAIVPVLVLVVVAGQVESWRDFRVFAPHLLVVLLLLAVRGGWERWAWVATVALLPVHYNGFVAFHGERFTADPRPIVAMQAATEQAVPFVDGADPWSNTVLVHSDLLQFPLLGLPQGIAVSYVFDWDNLGVPVRSRFLLLRPADEEQVRSKVKLTPLVDTPLGMMYRNDGVANPAGEARRHRKGGDGRRLHSRADHVNRGIAEARKESTDTATTVNELSEFCILNSALRSSTYSATS